MLTEERVFSVIADCIRQLNLARTPDQQLEMHRSAILFGEGSPLDSLGLVSLVIDIEQAFLDEGYEISLSDEKTMSKRNSPFKTVETLALHIRQLMDGKDEA